VKALLIIAHGSRREASNDEVRRLVFDLKARAGDDGFESVSCAFLELAEPSIPDAVDACVSDGATEITVLPYFLSAGRHVVEDIPAELDIGRRRHPDVTLRVLPYVGAESGMRDLILEMVGQGRA